jgi:hypothetical protein
MKQEGEERKVLTFISLAKGRLPAGHLKIEGKNQ